MAAEGAAAAAGRRRTPLSARPWWPAAKRIFTIAFFALVLGLVANQARTVDWPSVLDAIRAYRAQTLLVAAALAAASFAVYCCYDLVGRQQTGHGVAPLKVAGIAFVSYAFNLNLGSLVGGIAFRYRLYSGHGLETPVITKVVVLSMLTNWLGYLAVGGAVFLFAPIALPPDWKLGSEGLRYLGAGMMAAAAAYLALCGFSKRREWRVRGDAVHLPSARVALVQLALSSVNWLVIAAVIYTLLQQKVDYFAVLSVFLVAAVAGVITHVPAGLGVLEAVFVALLAHRVPQGELLAALLAYRAIYYLAPLAIAALLFFAVDVK
ncbi:MAG: UPF0104 family protein, partial [Rhizobiales bacterium]|nr:UPF0104 family protein [Rhizobacter sp.]